MQSFAHGDYFRVVNQQQRNRNAGDRRPRAKSRTVLDKVLRPAISPGMEQANDFAAVWIKSGNIWSLEAVAMNAGEGQIVERCRSAMLSRDNVIDLEWSGMKRGR